MIEIRRNSIIERLQEFRVLLLLSIFVLFSSLLVYYFYDFLYLNDTYLNKHSLLEGANIFFFVMIFFVTFHSYLWSRNLRGVIIGSIFLNTALIDLFHSLSFKEITNINLSHDNDMSLKLYIAARLLGGIGLLAAGFLRGDRKSQISRFTLLIPLTLINMLFLDNILNEGIIYNWFGACNSNLYIYQSILILLYTIAFIVLTRQYLQTKDQSAQFLMGASFMLIVSEIIFLNYFGVYHGYTVLAHIIRIVSSYLVFHAMFSDSVKKPYYELSSAREEIDNYANNLESLVDEGASKIRELNENLLKDLGYARDIKKAVLPPKHLDYSKVEIYAKYIPSDNITGQFYKLLRLGKENILMMTGKIACKGIPSTMLTIFINQTVKSMVMNRKKHDVDKLSPASVLKNTLEHYKEMDFENDVSILLAVYNIRHNTITHASTGNENYAAVYDRESGIKSLTLQTKDNMKTENILTDSYMELKKGELVVMYAGCSSSSLAGSQRNICGIIDKTVKKDNGKPLIEIQENLAENITRSWLGNDKSDIAFIIMEVK